MDDLSKPARLASLASALALLPDAPEVAHPVGDAAIAAHVEYQEGQLASHLVKCGVPERIARAVATGLQVEDFPAVPRVRAWMGNTEAIFLLLAGSTGCGKTYAAAECLRLVRKPFHGYDGAGVVFSSWQYASDRALFTTAAALAARASWTEDGHALWTRARNADLLVLDDLGVETGSDRSPFTSDFQDLIGERHAGARRTALTTNLDAKTLSARYGSRVLDRILERGQAYRVGDQSKRGRLQ